MQNFWNYLSADICRIKIGFWMDMDLGWKLLALKQKTIGACKLSLITFTSLVASGFPSLSSMLFQY